LLLFFVHSPHQHTQHDAQRNSARLVEALQALLDAVLRPAGLAPSAPSASAAAIADG
jgi:hypothetical protein